MIVTANPAFWEKQLNTPLINRIGAAPPELLNYVALSNNDAGSLSAPAEIQLAADFFQDVQFAIAEMPSCVQALLHRPLLGVFFARGLGSSAVTDVVTTANGKTLGVLTLMDADAFASRSANAWASWKENTPFLPDPAFSINAVIEEPANDNRKNAIQFLLLHEFGHVLTAQSEFLPDWWIGSQKFKSSEEYSYLSFSWQLSMAGDIIPLLREDFARRKLVSYYSDEQLDAKLAPEIYQALAATTFPSLYASINAYDDFAEAFATYVHVVLMKKPFQITIAHNGTVVTSFSHFWGELRAQHKFKFFADYLGDAV